MPGTPGTAALSVLSAVLRGLTRRLLIPLKATAINLLGLAVMFGVAYGLSINHEVFLFSRNEERCDKHPDRPGRIAQQRAAGQ